MNREKINDLEALTSRLDCGVDLLNAIRITLELCARDAAPAVAGAYDYMLGLVKELRQLVEREEEEV